MYYPQVFPQSQFHFAQWKNSGVQSFKNQIKELHPIHLKKNDQTDEIRHCI